MTDAPLTLADFADAVGESFEMEANGESLAAELVEASPLSPSDRPGGSFRLEFRGPCDPAFMHGTFPFRRAGRTYEIYVSAIARDAAGTRYEAVFY